MPSTHRTLIADAATLATPLMLVLGVRTFLAPTASIAGSAIPVAHQAPAAPTPPTGTLKLTAEQQRTADWLTTLPPAKGLSSPLDHPTFAPPPPPPVVEAATPDPAPPARAVDPLAGIRLTAILGNAEGGLAAINGRVYKIGDPVRPGLRLKRIDAKTSTVFFSLDDGTELKLHRPPEEGLR